MTKKNKFYLFSSRFSVSLDKILHLGIKKEQVLFVLLSIFRIFVGKQQTMLLRILKFFAWLIGIIIVLLIGLVLLLNTSWVQNKLLGLATDMLSEKLQTKVAIDRVKVDLFAQSFDLHGLMVEDRQQRKMLAIDLVKAEADLWQLLNDEVKIDGARIYGLRAELHHEDTDSVANYQFVIDAFRKDKKTDKKPEKPKTGKKLTVNLNELTLEQIALSYNDKKCSFRKLIYRGKASGERMVEAQGVDARWVRHTKKGPRDNILHVGTLHLLEQDGKGEATLDTLRLKTDNHKPRKNTGKPHRGFFDMGHLDITAFMKVDLHHISKDTIVATVERCRAFDLVTGFDLRSITCGVTVNKGVAAISNLRLQQRSTILNVKSATVVLPNKKKGRKLSYQAPSITGTVILSDISRPFAPVLRHFNLPLLLSTSMNGDDNSMTFHNVSVKTTDNQFVVKTKGTITDLKDKYKLRIHFDIDQASAAGDVAERIINQFKSKKFMMKQLRALGTISIYGGFNVLYRKEQFQGRVHSRMGDINVNFTLDEENKYVTGKASTDSLELGRVMDMEKIGPISASADFKFDYSKPRTAEMRRLKGGKLPIGEVKAHVARASYKFVKVKNLDVEIKSDGAIAEGSLQAPRKFIDLSCNFSFTDTDKMKDLHVKPRLGFHLFGNNGMTDEERAAAKEKKRQEKEERKAAKQAEKEEKRAARQQAKEEHRQEKAERQAVRQAEKEEKRAARQQAKEQRRQEKAERKAAKQKAKEGTSVQTDPI